MAAQTLMVATRKGLFEFAPHERGLSVKAHHFAGEPVTAFHVESTTGAWFAAQNLGHFGVKLKRSADRGATWQEWACPAFPEKPTSGEWANDETPWSVGHIWSMADDGAGTLWAGCMPAGLFRSRDGGRTWDFMRTLWFNEKRKAWMGGGNDHPGIHSIVVDPRNAKNVTVAISCGGLWRTEDGGETWANIGHGQVNNYMPPEQQGDPNTQDPHRIDVCAASPNVWWMQHHCGLFRSTDAGANWTQLPKCTPSDFGFPILADPANPRRAWMIPTQADTHRYAHGGAMCVNRTDDGGQTWQTFRNGLPQSHAYHLIYRHGLALADDGKTIAMASTTGGVWVSADAGESWRALDVALPLVSAVVWL
jgi:photosystem II stability/assembly factor-like uncharacterized protein